MRIFEFTNGDWSQIGSDLQGTNDAGTTGDVRRTVWFSGDGNTVCGASTQNSTSSERLAKTWRWNGSDWAQLGNTFLVNQDAVTSSSSQHSAISYDGNILAIGGNQENHTYTGEGEVTVYEYDSTNDIRIFDGDILFFPKLSNANPNQLPKSILSGITPKYISVNLFGKIENPGVIKVPLDSALSDLIDISGPIKPLSGKIVLIRYEDDGSVTKKYISYSARAKKGSERNPFLKKDDLISVKNSFFGKSTGIIKEITAPFVGIYSTKELIEGFSE